MQEQNGLTPAEQELELAMKSLSPSATRIDPVAAAFDAGRRSSQKYVRLWRAAAVFILLIGAGSWLAPARHITVVRPHEVSEPAIALQPSQPPAAESLQALQQTVSEKGLDGLPAANVPTVHILRVEDSF
jgi:hypothetical protein